MQLTDPLRVNPVKGFTAASVGKKAKVSVELTNLDQMRLSRPATRS